MRRIVSVALAAVAAGASLGPAPALGQSAVAYQLNIAHDGQTAFPAGFAPPLKKQWVRDLGGWVSYPVIVNGVVYVTVGNTVFEPGTQLYALDLATGETIWHRLIGGPYYWSNVTYDAGRIFLMNGGGYVQALSADSAGTLLWTMQLPEQWSYETAPIAFDGHLYVAGSGNGGTFFSLAQQDGSIVWATHLSNGANSSPAFGEGKLFLDYTGQYLAYDLTGKIVWGKKGHLIGGGGKTPAYYEGRVYERDEVNGSYIRTADTGAIVGPLDSESVPAFWKHGKKSYMMAEAGGHLTCREVKHRKLVWTFDGDGQLSGSPIVINDVVAIGSANGVLHIVDAATGAELWSDRIGPPIGGNPGIFPWTSLGAGEDYLVVPATNKIAAYAMKNKELARR